MIELNLIPDVKQELIKAHRQRALVISASILVSIIGGVIVVLFGLFVFGGQTFIIGDQQRQIKEQDDKLHSVADLEKTLTIQNQLRQITILHDGKGIVSNLQYVLSPINPKAPNNVKFSKISLDTAEGVITIDAQADGNYEAFETFKKTLKATKLSYVPVGEKEKVTISLVKEGTEISEGNPSYGKDDTGKTVLRFTISFTYAEELFARSSKDVRVQGPSVTDATDSFQGLPTSIFDNRAQDQEAN